MLLLPVEGYVESAGHFSASDTASYMFQGPCKNERQLKNQKTVLLTWISLLSTRLLLRYIVQCLPYIYVFLKSLEYHPFVSRRRYQCFSYTDMNHTIHDYLSHSNNELFGIPLFLGSFSQAFSVVCCHHNLRTSRLFLSLQSFPFACSHSNITHLLLTGVKIVVKDILKLFEVLRCSLIKRNDRYVYINNQVMT